MDVIGNSSAGLSCFSSLPASYASATARKAQPWEERGCVLAATGSGVSGLTATGSNLADAGSGDLSPGWTMKSAFSWYGARRAEGGGE
jgi:hypothetical protein